MVTVSDILALPAFKKVSPVVSCARAGSRRVHNVGILDCPPSYNGYSAYMPGEFIVTNLGFTDGDEDLSRESLIAMIGRNVSAIAIKTVYQPQVDEHVARASETSGVPVYLYDGSYHEMVAYQALDLIRRDEIESDSAKAIDKLLAPKDPMSVRKALEDIADIRNPCVSCLAILPDDRDDCSLYALISTVRSELENIYGNKPTSIDHKVLRYHDAILVVSSAPDVTLLEEDRSYAEQAIASAGSLHCGISLVVDAGYGDFALSQALSAAREAKINQLKAIHWEGMGHRAFECAAQESHQFVLTAHAIVGAIADYDRDNGTDLLRTARAYTEANGNTRIAADSLFQHPNTMRYRVKKIRSLVNAAEADEINFLTMMKMAFASLPNANL